MKGGLIAAGHYPGEKCLAQLAEAIMSKLQYFQA